MDLELWQGRRVLITGHTGFKGAWLTFLLKKLGASVHGFSISRGPEGSLYLASHLVDLLDSEALGDIRDESEFAEYVERVQPEVVFHLAAMATVQDARSDPAGAFSTNVLGTYNVLHGAIEAGAKVIVAATTDKVYQNNEWAWPYREIDPLGGKDPYSASKSASENVIACLRELNPTISLTAVRAGNVIGGGDATSTRLIPDLASHWSASEVTNLRMPNATRPWQHVLDCLRGYILTAEAGLRGADLPPALNFGPIGSLSVLETAHLFYEAVGEKLKPNIASSQQPEHSRLELDSNLARNHLGWQPLISMRKSVQSAAQWYLSLRAGLDARVIAEQTVADFFTLAGLAKNERRET